MPSGVNTDRDEHPDRSKAPRPPARHWILSFVRYRMRTSLSLAPAWITAMLLGSSVLAQPLECTSGLHAFERKEWKLTVDLISQCLSLPLPKSQRAYVLRARGQAHAQLGQFAAALKDQQESMALQKPKDVWPWIDLAIDHRELRQFDEALAALRSAQDYDEDGPGTGPGMAVYYHTGWTFHAAGRYAEAIEAYTKGIQKQAGYGYALYRRALSYEALGDRLQAERDLSRAAELAPKDGYEPEIAAKLKEYGLEVRVRRN